MRSTHRTRWIILAIGCLILIGAAASSNKTGPTSSPALVTTSSPTPASSTPAAAQTFRGDGSENIGTVNVPTQSTLHWSCATCAHENFVVSNNVRDAGLIDVDALGPASGQTVLDAGTYHDVAIDTEGQAWSIRIVPGT